MHKGFINIGNPFRGSIVLGTPGSGKSFGIIDPFITVSCVEAEQILVIF